MHEIYSDEVDLKDFCNYLRLLTSEAESRRAEFVFSVDGHEIVC